MDSFEFNKIVGAVLGTVFVLFSVSIISDAIFAAPVPENPGYAIEAAEEETAPAGDEGPTEEPIAALLASADPAAGEAVFKRCAACHTVDEGGANRTGPNLWDIVNRPIAAHEGFAYSNAMKEFSQGGSVVWDYEHLSGFLTAPKSYIKGTAMSFAGLKKPDERANLIAYLRTLSDDPAPLPTAEAPVATEAAAPAGDAAPAEGTGEAAPAEGSEEAAPAGEAAPAEGAEGTEEDAPAGGAAPAEGQAPAEGAADAPAAEEAPVTEAPAAEEVPTDEEEPAPAQ